MRTARAGSCPMRTSQTASRSRSTDAASCAASSPASPMEGLAAADAMILFRSTVKAICARLGLHATFMCWPALPNFFPNGSHLHLSLLETESGRNAFADNSELLSPTGRRFVAGLLDHA